MPSTLEPPPSLPAQEETDALFEEARRRQRRRRRGIAIVVVGVALATVLLLRTGASGPKRPSQPSSAAPAVAAQLPRCHSSELAAHPAFAGVGGGSVQEIVTFTNTSTTTCTLHGYPGLQMLDRSGHSIPTHVRGGWQSYAGRDLPSRLVRLRPGGPASFETAYEDSTGYSGVTCPSATTVEITPPGAYEPITIKWALNPYGGLIQDLHCGKVRVSPVYAGTAPAGESE